MEWIDQLKVNREIAAAPAASVNPLGDIVAQLRDAGHRFDKRGDNFAQGKGSICRDIADKVEHFGSFATDKQRDFALKLIEWSKPRSGAVNTAAPALVVPNLFGVMQKHSHFYAEPLKLSRKNQDTLCWIIWHGQCVGKIEDARVTLFSGKLGRDLDKVRALIVEFNADPLEAAKKYGKLSGRCCSCGRDLTDPVSIEAGIGPVCAQRFS
jgi:uncharacterized protein DUF6011